MCRKPSKRILYIFLTFFSLFSFLMVGTIAHSSDLNLSDYERLLYGRYSQYLPLLGSRSLSLLSDDLAAGPADEPYNDEVPVKVNGEEGIKTELNLEGELYLNLQYGKDFSLKKNAVVGAGSSGITSGLKYDLIERVRLEGSVADRLFVEFDYDSERSEEGLTEETNTYSLLYKGRNDEFLKEATLGNKYLSIEGSRFVPIDEGNQDSFALRALASWRDLYLDGLLRYDVATEGKKQFRGFRKNVDMQVLDVDYARGRFFFLPDIDVNEATLLLYRSTDLTGDLVVDGKEFRLLTRGVDFDFDNFTGRIYMEDDLALDEELIVYYEKGGNPVGDPALGDDAIIDSTGTRDNFDSTSFSEYFDATTTYLYLKKQSFNSYWELRNIYYLEEIEGENIYDFEIELLYTLNSGINNNYDYDDIHLLDDYEIETSRGIILFNFDDAIGFYPRPFPGEYPFTHPTDPVNPFDPDNPIYGGLNYPTSDKSINTIHLTYSYSAESFFLDFNLVPGSVKVKVNGNPLDSAYYEVDHEFGIITFAENVIGPASDIEVSYRYNPFGEGDKSLFAAFGLTYEGASYRVRNLTSFRGSIRGKEAPEVGNEPSRKIVNSTEFEMGMGREEEEEGMSASLKGGVAFAFTNKNSYGSALVADMERDDYLYELSLDDDDWIIATTHSSLTSPLPLLGVTFGSRGDLLYKNYYKETTFSGDVLQTLSWDIPSSQVFAYSEKAGPYNTADRPTGGNETSLVMDYNFAAVGDYVSMVIPLSQENLEGYQRFNMLLRGDSITDNNISVYAELLKVYDENLDGDIPPKLDGENTINDLGFPIQPIDGNPTVIGTNREGKSNGRIDSEDINGNGNLDGPDEGEVIREIGGTNEIVQINEGERSWEYVSVDVLDLIASNREVFQYANAVRITVQATAVGPGPPSGKVVINKIWFSGSGIVNNSEDDISISDVSEYEDSDVRNNAFSESYPGLYEELHGTARYRSRNEYVEKVLRVKVIKEIAAPNEVSLSKRFGTPADLSFYKEFRLFFFLPASEDFSNATFGLTFLSSQNESLEADAIPGSGMLQGWNEVFVELTPPYTVKLNDTTVDTMEKLGTLRILKRVSEIRFSMVVDSLTVAEGSEFWLDEWYVSESINFFDKALFTEAGIDYQGELLYIGSVPMIENPFLNIGYEHLEGSFYEDFDYKSDRFYTDMGTHLFRYADAGFAASKEVYAPIRNEEELPNNLEEGGFAENFSHRIGLDFQKDYIPVLQHTYDRVVTEDSFIELTQTSYRYKRASLYSDSLGLSEYIDFPFGLYQSYSFFRSWALDSTLTTSPETSFTPDIQETATLNQTKDLLFSFSWDINSLSVNFKRDKTYGGSSILDMERWLDSYWNRLGSVFSPPEDDIEDAALSTKTDTFALDLSIPLQKSVGSFFSYDTSFNESGFQYPDKSRNTLVRHALALSFPFYFPANERIEIVPSLQREISADYKNVEANLKEWDILLNTGKYIFMPPFYYINPIKGLGRIKDYDAVDEYKDSGNIEGNTSATLKNEYMFDTYFQYDEWFVPSSLGFGFSGETKREGESYTQKRGFSASYDKTLYLDQSSKFFDKSLTLSLDYSNEKNYATKILSQTYTTQTNLNLLKEEWKGWKLQYSLSYSRERQKIDEEQFYLVPGSPEKEVLVPEKPPKDTIDSKIVCEYFWEYYFKRDPFFAKIESDLLPKTGLQNTERLTLENIYTFTDRQKAASFSNIPVRLTLEHESSYRMTENIEFGGYLKTVIGVEEKVLPPSISGNVLSSMGFEIGMYARIIF